MKKHELEKLLDKYLKGNCNEQEMKLLHQFYDSFQDDEIEMQPHEIVELQNDIYHEVDHSISETKKKSIRLQINPAWVKTAALLVFVLGIGLLAYFEKSPEPLMTSTSLAWVEKTTKNGQRATFELMDGSKVHLNAGSTLSFPEDFEGDIREVHLVGEAFFEVKRDTKKPFIVKSGNIETTVLGTSFNIKSYKNEPDQVTVATGKVKVSSTSNGLTDAVFLEPQQQAIFDQSLEKKNVDLEPYLAWRDKVLHFDRLALSEAVPILERWYGVSISIENEDVLKCKISGKYKNESLVNVLHSMEYILGIDYQFQKERSLLIRGGSCHVQS